MDPDNSIVKLCAEGMQAEGEGNLNAAQRCFQQAWAAHQDHFEACIAAHFMARHQPPADMLHWNQVALDHAAAVDDERVRGFYPSLYLNLGWSHEQMSNLTAARHYYDLAAARLSALTDDPYAAVVRKGITAGQARITEALAAQ